MTLSIQVDEGSGFRTTYSATDEAMLLRLFSSLSAKALAGSLRAVQLLGPTAAVMDHVARRCAFCDIHDSWRFLRRKLLWIDVGGRPVCGAECAEKELARQACEPEPLPVVLELDGWWAADGEGHIACSRESEQDARELLDLEVLS